MIQFADSVGNIQVFNQVVRIELLRASVPAAGQTQPELQAAGHLMLSIDGLIKTFAALENTMRQLAEAGIISRAGANGDPMPADAPAQMGNSAGGKKKRHQ